MNKIVFTARMAKGISKKELADKLNISEQFYDELEFEIAPISIEVAEKLEAIYEVPAEYFLTGATCNIQAEIDALESQKEMLKNFDFPDNVSISAKVQLSVAKMGFDAVICRQEQVLLLYQNRELKLENEAIRQLYKNKIRS